MVKPTFFTYLDQTTNFEDFLSTIHEVGEEQQEHHFWNLSSRRTVEPPNTNNNIFSSLNLQQQYQQHMDKFEPTTTTTFNLQDQLKNGSKLRVRLL